MNRAHLLAGALAFLAAPALGQTPPAPTAPAPNPPAQSTPAPAPSATPAPATPAPAAPSAASNTPSTADFVNKAAISGMFEIQSSELALRKHVRSDRQFAEHMIRDHRRLAAQLARVIRVNHVDVQIPSKLDDEHQKMLDQLRGESGQTFEKDYAQMQQQGHQDAVALFQSYSQNGDNPALKNAAAKALPILQDHLAMAQKLS